MANESVSMSTRFALATSGAKWMALATSARNSATEMGIFATSSTYQ